MRARRLQGRTLALLSSAMLAALVTAAACGGEGNKNSDASTVAPPAAPPVATATEPAETPAATSAIHETAANEQAAAIDQSASASDSESTNAEEQATNASATEITVTAYDTYFDTKTITAAANTPINVTLENKGALPHNLSFLTKEGGTPLSAESVGAIILEGETATVEFTTPGPGTYFFYCAVHPQQMTGTFIVQ